MNIMSQSEIDRAIKEASINMFGKRNWIKYKCKIAMNAFPKLSKAFLVLSKAANSAGISLEELGKPAINKEGELITIE